MIAFSSIFDVPCSLKNLSRQKEYLDAFEIYKYYEADMNKILRFEILEKISKTNAEIDLDKIIEFSKEWFIRNTNFFAKDEGLTYLINDTHALKICCANFDEIIVDFMSED